MSRVEKSRTIPNNVVKILGDVFDKDEVIDEYHKVNRKITSITIPSSVKVIDMMAFYELENLKKIIFEDSSKCTFMSDNEDVTDEIKPLIVNNVIDLEKLRNED